MKSNKRLKVFDNILLIFILLVLIACNAQNQSDEMEYNGFQYKYFRWGVTITGYTGDDMDIIIPENIKNRPVIGIDGGDVEIVWLDESFSFSFIFNGEGFQSKNISSVIIPSTVLSIYGGSFANNSIAEINLHDNFSSISDYAFMNNRISSIIIPDSVWHLGARAFENNEISDIKISNRLEWISNAAFKNNKITSLAIPENVTRIGWWAFADNEIEELNLTNNLYITCFAFEIIVSPILQYRMGARLTAKHFQVIQLRT